MNQTLLLLKHRLLLKNLIVFAIYFEVLNIIHFNLLAQSAKGHDIREDQLNIVRTYDSSGKSIKIII